MGNPPVDPGVKATLTTPFPAEAIPMVGADGGRATPVVELKLVLRLPTVKVVVTVDNACPEVVWRTHTVCPGAIVPVVDMNGGWHPTA